MTPEQVELIRASWSKVEPIAPTAAELFYGRLFELDPSVKPLFKGDMKDQGAKLMSVIGMVVSSLDRLDEIVPAVQDLGRRHVAYGVQDGHYDTVGAALIWTLEQGLKDDFSSEARDAWSGAYGVLASVMKEAAAAMPAPQAKSPPGLFARIWAGLTGKQATT